MKPPRHLHMNVHVVVLLLFALSSQLCVQAEPPTDNAVASYYTGPEGYPAWTGQIRWSNVIDMSQYPHGHSNFERFENARDELAAKGGGVLYYPGGVYDFSDGPFDGPNGRGLMLRSGVVIRGESPAQDAPATTGRLQLPTKFRFGFKRRNNAIDAGRRMTLVLSDGDVRARKRGNRPATYDRADLILSFAVAHDEIQRQIKAFPAGRTREQWTGTAAIHRTGQTMKLDVELPISEQDKVEKARYEITLNNVGDECKGDFTGVCRGRTIKGPVEGRFITITPETPRHWNLIGLMPEPGERISNVNNVGVAWVHLVGGVIYFGPDIEWGDTWVTAQSWKSPYVKQAWSNRVPDGTHPWDPFAGGGTTFAGSGSGRLVFGCVLEDAAVVNDMVKMGRPDYKDGFGKDGYYMHKFGPRVAAYGSHVFVANNLLPQSTGRNFKYRQTTRRTFPRGGAGMGFDPPRESIVLFDYNKTPGIEINKSLLGLTKGSMTGQAGNGYFRPGIVVVDNYVYNNGHKGFDISGSWVTIARNHNERHMLVEGWDPERIGGWELTLDGHMESSPGGNGAISDNLSRAFDLGGRNLWVHKNTYNNLGSNPGNDGEGILCQAHGGSHLYSWAVTYNVHEKGHGETGYIGAWDVDAVGALFGWNALPGWVGAINVANRDAADVAFAANQAGRGVKPMKGAQIGNTPGHLRAPVNVKLEVIDDIAVCIAWDDASDNEVGFRIDRRIEDLGWRAIAYRPPSIEGHKDNPQIWIDYCAPAGKPLTYRVAAIDSKDDNKAASEPIRMSPLPCSQCVLLIGLRTNRSL